MPWISKVDFKRVTNSGGSFFFALLEKKDEKKLRFRFDLEQKVVFFCPRILKILENSL